MSEAQKILIVDDDPLVRETIARVARKIFPDIELTMAESPEQALDKFHAAPSHLIILDLNLGRKSGLIVIRQVRISNLTTPILVLSSYKEDEAAVPSLQAGANGYLCKAQAVDDATLGYAISVVLRGGRYISDSLASKLIDEAHLVRRSAYETLSAQEGKVLLCLARGNSVKETSHILDVNIKTVRTYRTRLLQKLNLKTDADIVRYAIENGIVE